MITINFVSMCFKNWTTHTTVHSFVELGPQLLRLDGVEYLLSEVFSQDPLERYFSRQRHRGGSCENPTAQLVPYNAATLVQQKVMYRDLKTMNVELLTWKKFRSHFPKGPDKANDNSTFHDSYATVCYAC